MANWQHTLHLEDLWKQYKADEVDAKFLGCEIAKRLRRLSLPKEFSGEVEEIAFGLEQVDDIEEFDDALDRLYDLADTSLHTPVTQMQRRLLWVATF